MSKQSTPPQLSDCDPRAVEVVIRTLEYVNESFPVDVTPEVLADEQRRLKLAHAQGRRDVLRDLKIAVGAP